MSKDVRRLQNLKVVSVGLVTKGANKQQWILFKDAEGTTMKKIKKSDLKKLTPATIKKMGMTAGDAKKLLMAIEGSEEAVSDATLEMLKRIAEAAPTGKGDDEEEDEEEGMSKSGDEDEGDDDEEAIEKDDDEDGPEEDEEDERAPVRKSKKAVRRIAKSHDEDEGDDEDEDDEPVVKSADRKVERILKAQKAEIEELRKSLDDQKDQHTREALIRKSADKWPNLPARSADVGEFIFKLQKLDKKLAKSLTDLFDRIQGAISQNDLLEKELGSAGWDGDESNPESKLEALAKSFNKDNKLTAAQAMAQVYKTREGRDLLRQMRKGSH